MVANVPFDATTVTQRMAHESHAQVELLIQYYQQNGYFDRSGNPSAQQQQEDEAENNNRVGAPPLDDVLPSMAAVTPRLRPPTLWTSKSEVSAFVRDCIDIVLFDCDGVVYRSPHPAPGARDCIRALIERGKQIFFVTNNASLSRQELKHKLETILDFQTQADRILTEQMMVGSAYATAQYLYQTILLEKKKTHPERKARLFVIGSKGLCQELEKTGFDVFTVEDQIMGDQDSSIHLNSETHPPPYYMTRDDLATYDFPEHPFDAVVVGTDPYLHFRKLCIAQVLLQKNPQAPLVATNLDNYDLVGADAREIPANGGTVKYLEFTSRRTAVDCGKPSAWLAHVLAVEAQNSNEDNKKKTSIAWSRALFVGDRLETDIRFGIDTGMHTALVMTGVTSAGQIQSLLQEQQHNSSRSGDITQPLPEFIVPHIGFLASTNL